MINVESLKVKGTNPIVKYRDNTLYCIVTSYENDGDYVKKEFVRIDNLTKLSFYKVIFDNYFTNNDSAKSMVLRIIKAIDNSGDMQKVIDYIKYSNVNINIEYSDIYDLIYNVFSEVLGYQPNSNSFRSLDGVDWCYFDIKNNQQVMVEV